MCVIVSGLLMKLKNLLQLQISLQMLRTGDGGKTNVNTELLVHSSPSGTQFGCSSLKRTLILRLSPSSAQLERTDRNRKDNYHPGCSDHRLTTTLLLRAAKQKRCSGHKKGTFQNKWGFSIWMDSLLWWNKVTHCFFKTSVLERYPDSVHLGDNSLQAVIFQQPHVPKRRTNLLHLNVAPEMAQQCLSQGHSEAQLTHGPCSLKDMFIYCK